MKVEVNNGTQARRLELDGYNRYDTRVVIVNMDGFEQLLDRDDITVSQVRINRNSTDKDGGADLIDDYVRAQVPDRNRKGRINRVYFQKPYSTGSMIKRQERRLLDVDEDTLMVYSHFREAILDGPITDDIVDMDSFEDAKEAALDQLDEEIAALRSQRETIAETQLDDVE